MGKPGDLPSAPDLRPHHTDSGSSTNTRRCICNRRSTRPLAVKVLPRPFLPRMAMSASRASSGIGCDLTRRTMSAVSCIARDYVNFDYIVKFDIGRNPTLLPLSKMTYVIKDIITYSRTKEERRIGSAARVHVSYRRKFRRTNDVGGTAAIDPNGHALCIRLQASDPNNQNIRRLVHCAKC
jgi:hypothetical protein